MKNIFLLGLILFSIISCKAQTIVPVEKAIDYRRAGEGIPDNTYLKDVNNLLAKYTGTWKGSYGGKNYTFYITKTTSKFETVTRDRLLIRYLITSSNGTVLENTQNMPDTNPYVVKGSYFSKDLTAYALNFSGKKSQCGNAGTVFIHIDDSAKNILSFGFEPDKIMISEDSCPGFKVAELTFPKDGLKLTKQ